MGPPGGYPPRTQRTPGTCYNCGEKGHYSPNCPYPRNNQTGYVPLCGNCGEEGHLPPECPKPAQPKMLVKYVKEPEPKDANVRLIFIEEAQPEEVEANTCEPVEFLEGQVMRTATRSMT